ncbi:uncharacterized protein LOC121695217 [Alosa sapidissima]|uniref:uncharacterized protein LOC121695217 n=1 Tax=Alosa sapidissima TaxID=34773 RepID=UPI001C08A6FC|nr:uncharacterized protein LOC121695217 [Alosa sapidissima]
MSAESKDEESKVVSTGVPLLFSPGDDITLPCHLSALIPALPLEIRWFRNTDCIYLYRNGQVAEGRGYEGRVSVDPQELQRGDVSLRLRGTQETDRGWFLCQVIQGEHQEEARVGFLYPRERGAIQPGERGYNRAARRRITAEERKVMEESVRALKILGEVAGGPSEPIFCDQDPPHSRKRRSFDLPLNFGGESPGPAVSELRLVLLGGSTAGKRAAGNTILGTHTLTHTSTETQHSESRQGEVAGRRMTVVDTPDWFCSGLSEKDMREDVGLCIRLSAPGPHAFLLVIPVEPSEGEERRMLEKMEDIFGEGCWGHTLILFTHAEGLRERSVEELLQTESQDLQQLVEKCGNRCHLLNVKGRPDDTEITQLLIKIEEMVSGNRERFYSSETYQEAERQLREIERRMQKEQEVKERKLMEERERREEHFRNVQESLKRMEGEIQTLSETMQDQGSEAGEGWDEEKRKETDTELHRLAAVRAEMEGKLSRERERVEKEQRHKEERAMREGYEREARAEVDSSLRSILLPELLRISTVKADMEREFSRQMEEKNREMEEKNREMEEKNRQMEEKNREMDRMRQMLDDRKSESEDMRQAIQRLSTSLLKVMGSEEQLRGDGAAHS